MSFIVTPATPAVATVPGGSNTQVQFNDSSAFGGDANFTFDKTTNVLGVDALTGTALTFTLKPAAASASSDSPILNLSGQAGGSAALGGAVNITGGAGGTEGGVVLISSGANPSGGGGALIRVGGILGAELPDDIRLETNNRTTAADPGGNVNVLTGTGGAGAAAGSFKVYAGGFLAFRVGCDSTGARLIGLYSATPVARATVAGAASVFVANAGVAVFDVSTFDGYTLAQVVKALRNIGALT